MSNKLKIIPLGGLGEVGKNMMAYEIDNHILVVDAGMMFPENDMIGVDYIIPDFEYLYDKSHQVDGIIITHGHEDHIGAIQHVLSRIPAPVFGTNLTLGLVEVKLARNGMAAKADLRPIRAGETIQIGPFTVDFFHVCHSIPDAVGLGITTKAGLVVHTGDYKFDHTPVDGKASDYARLANYSEHGVLALLADSTNSERAGWTPSEKVVDAGLEDVFSQAAGRIIIASFASMPWARRSMAKSTIMMAFFLTMPISITTPIMAITERSMPASSSMTKAPMPAEGRPDRMVSGWMKLS